MTSWLVRAGLFGLTLSMVAGLTGSGTAQAQNKPVSDKPVSNKAGFAPEPMAVDARIAAALQQVSAEHIRSNIDRLVSFGTRATLSAQDPASIAAGRGIGAAREWIKSEF